MKNLFYIIFLSVSFISKAQERRVISGVIRDDKDQVIPGATVFITNSKYITTTDSNGEFNFNTIPPGAYDVVVKMIGFNTLIKNIILQKKSIKILFVLTESNTILNTVNITDTDPNRKRRIEVFIKNFIGETVNSSACKLLNTNILRFKFDKSTNKLQASASDFLIVENKALGYKIKYLLTEFEYDWNTHTCTSGGYPYFEEMTGTSSQQEKWEMNRKMAYLSSERYFFRSLVENTLKKNGYLVYLITNNPSFRPWGDLIQDHQKKLILVESSKVDSLFISNNTDLKTLLYNNKIIKTDTSTVNFTGLYIIYTGQKESALFYKTGSPINLLIDLPGRQKQYRQISIIKPVIDTVDIYKNGGLNPAKSFIYTGYWAWQRIADLTPMDYVAKPAEIKNKVVN